MPSQYRPGPRGGRGSSAVEPGARARERAGVLRDALEEARSQRWIGDLLGAGEEPRARLADHGPGGVRVAGREERLGKGKPDQRLALLELAERSKDRRR